MTTMVKYSDEELALFKANIEQKLNKAKNDFDFLMEQIQDVAEARDGDGDFMDDAANSNDLERLYGMAGRQRNYVRDLETALLRIRNKTYGVCTVTGELIDKRRLLAVPITTKSLAAKNAVLAEQPKKREPRPVPAASKKPKPPVVISRVIRKAPTPSVILPKEDEDPFEDDFLEEDNTLSGMDYDNSFEDYEDDEN